MRGATEEFGRLRVIDSRLFSEDGRAVQLYGMSTHGIAWFSKYVCRETFTFLKEQWGINCVRLALYTFEYNGYCTGGDKEQLYKTVLNGVKLGFELGMYVIVDWHVLNERDPLLYMDEAVRFFERISKECAPLGNVIYEICNEPNTDARWEDITKYAETVIPVIRKNDPKSVILVGTPRWSQEIDKACCAPLEFENIMYTLHFYAATHKDHLRQELIRALDAGTPVFISEFGICDSMGSGSLDYEQGAKWRELIEDRGLSFICWNISDHRESAAILHHGCPALSGWDDDDLSEHGVWIRDWFLDKK